MKRLITALAVVLTALVLTAFTAAAATLVVNGGTLQAWSYSCEYDEIASALSCDES